MGQSRKQILTIALAAWMLPLGVALGSAATGPLVTTIVTDPLTGVALGGIDPVSYFTEGMPRPGLPAYEYDWQGVAWYFRNAANRDAFEASPEVYAPAFGGHGVMSLARGFLSDGDPQIYLVRDERVLLFYSLGNRDAFLMSEEAAWRAAEANWARLKGGLLGPVRE